MGNNKNNTATVTPTQEFDAGAVPEPNEPVYRMAAAGAVNIHPLARTFEGLVPVSLDAPPPRPKRKGKQVRREEKRRGQRRGEDSGTRTNPAISVTNCCAIVRAVR